MKTRKFRKIAAAIAACTLMASAMPVVPAASVAAGKNLISNFDFESGIADWGTYKESGGACTLTGKDGKLALTVSSLGKVNYAVQACYTKPIKLYKNGVYHLQYDVSCTVDRFIEGMIQMNGGDYRAYTWKGINATSEPQTIDYEFTMEEDTDIMAKLLFNCGIQEKYEGADLPEHTIYFDNFVLELVDDSEVDYSETEVYENDININQVGYRTDSKKTAVFRNVTDQTKFSVVNADTEEVVYSGDLEAAPRDILAEEDNWVADFSAVKTPGFYYISCEGLDDSYTFEISNGVYNNLLDDSIRMLYLQRCGTEVEDADFGHAACHTSIATVLDSNEKIDVTGGWHDAGDYGRYTVAAAKAVADLMYAYLENPALYSDSINIPESGNGVADILDETRYELEWMLKMQRADGGVYHKVSCATFPSYVMPTAEKNELIVTPVSTTATADFCASMALAAEVYKSVDSDFAAKCLAAAEKAWGFLEANPDFIFKNPESINTGEYGDKTDKDERYWATAQMYRATGDQKYLDALSLQKVATGLDWSTVGDYGNIALLTMKDIDKSSFAYTSAKTSLIKTADTNLKYVGYSAYAPAVKNFYWGSNMGIANAGNIFALAYKLTENEAYMDAANKQLDFLLGTNALGTSFVTGYGTVAPQNPHHRPSMVVGKAMPCMLVGGINPGLEDDAAVAYLSDAPSAKCWVDNAESYSTNEITIYWNSPLTYLIASTAGEDTGSDPTTRPTTPEGVVWGDANCDDTVSLADAIIVLQSISNPDKYSLSDQGAINADVDLNGNGISPKDALSIQKYLAHIITELPESFDDSVIVTTTTTRVTTSRTTTTKATTTTTTTTTTADDEGVVAKLVDSGQEEGDDGELNNFAEFKPNGAKSISVYVKVNSKDTEISGGFGTWINATSSWEQENFEAVKVGSDKIAVVNYNLPEVVGNTVKAMLWWPHGDDAEILKVVLHDTTFDKPTKTTKG